MNNLLTAAVVFFASAAVCFSVQAAPAKNDPLVAEISADQVPATVTITGPAELVDMLDTCVYRMGWITPGFSIDWGDGQQAGPRAPEAVDTGKPCVGVKSHTYTVPGTYKIRAKIYHLGPTDAPVTDWQSTMDVALDGTPGKTALHIVSPKEGATFLYQEFPPVQWNLDAGERVDIAATLMDAQAHVVAETMTLNIAFTGAGHSRLNLAGTAYEKALKDNAGPYKLHVAAMRDGKILAEDTVENIALSAELPPGISQMRVIPSEGRAPLMVALAYPHFHKNCFSYHVDWGDKTAATQAIKPMREGCVLEQSVLELTHTYSQPGEYVITIRTNNIDPFKKMDDIAAYEKKTIRVLP